MKNTIQKLLLAGICVSILALTGCGNAATISSLTDSDSMASTVGTTPSVTPTVNPLIPQSTNDSLPAIPAQAVGAASGATTPSVTPAVTAAPEVSPAAATEADAEPTQAPEEQTTEQETEQETEQTTDEETTDNEGTAEEEEFEPAGEGNTATATADVNFRSSPDTEDDNIINQISEGDSVTVISAEDGWYEVEYNGETGYVKADYFE